MGLCEEGIKQAREALEIFTRLGKTGQQTHCLVALASLLRQDEQLDAAEEAACRAMGLLENGNQYHLCQCHILLGEIHRSKGDTEKAIHHFETSLQIASPLNFHDRLFEGHFSLARLYFNQGRFNDALVHIEHAKSHTENNMLLPGRAFGVSAHALFGQNRFEEAKSDALRALAIFEKLGAADFAKSTRVLLEKIDRKIDRTQSTESE